MTAFILSLGVFLLLQIGHSRYLIREFPRLRPAAVRWILVILHLPMVGYFLLRVTGNTTLWIQEVLRPPARFGFYFQALTIVHLCSAALGTFFWRLWRRTKDPQPGPEDPSRRAFLRGSAALGAGSALATSLAGAASAFGDPDANAVDLAFPDLPEGLHGLRIAHLSDLHAGPMVSSTVMARWRRALDAARPDLVVFTGDLVDSRPEEVFPLLGAFQGLDAPLGVYAILGNHDYFTDPFPIWKSLEEAGIHCLENRHALIEHRGTSFALVGLQDPMARNGRFRGIHFGVGPDATAAIHGMPEGLFTICLNHRPSMWRLAKATGARLTLSGHTHGGQINLVPGLNSARFLGPYTAGLYREGNQALYVSRGLGVVGLPMRLNAPPELPLLRLVKG